MAETGENELTYGAIDGPTEARARGAIEILRAGTMSDDLVGAARPAFGDPGGGEVLADPTRRIAWGGASEGKYTGNTTDRARSRAKPRAKAPVRKTARRKAQ